mgnify:CR=1 FL=1
MFVKKHPNQVNIAQDRAGERDDGEDQTKNVVGSLRFLDHGGDTNDKFNNPVDARD